MSESKLSFQIHRTISPLPFPSIERLFECKHSNWPICVSENSIWYKPNMSVTWRDGIVKQLLRVYTQPINVHQFSLNCNFSVRLRLNSRSSGRSLIASQIHRGFGFLPPFLPFFFPPIPHSSFQSAHIIDKQFDLKQVFQELWQNRTDFLDFFLFDSIQNWND